MVEQNLRDPPLSPPSAKWGEAANAGFQILPDILLKRQKALGLNSADMIVLINLTSYWWYAEKKPFPRSSTIAARMGVDQRTVQRSLAKLENKGLIEKTTAQSEYGAQTVYSLDGLLRELAGHAVADPAYRLRVRVPPDAPGGVESAMQISPAPLRP